MGTVPGLLFKILNTTVTKKTLSPKDISVQNFPLRPCREVWHSSSSDRDISREAKQVPNKKINRRAIMNPQAMREKAIELFKNGFH
jgi:hypothetical protein